MADVTVEVAGRAYRLSCADGEEPHLRRLAAALDAEATALQRRLRMPAEEGRLLLMVALTMADRAAEAPAAMPPEVEERIAALEQALARSEARADSAETALTEAEERAEAAERAFAEAVDGAGAARARDLFDAEDSARVSRIHAAAERIEALTARLTAHLADAPPTD